MCRADLSPFLGVEVTSASEKSDIHRDVLEEVERSLILAMQAPNPRAGRSYLQSYLMATRLDLVMLAP